jgi:hypothetical protein
VSFVATRVLLAVRQEWGLRNDPHLLLLKDINKAWHGSPNASALPYEDSRFEQIISDSADAHFPVLWAARISLREISDGTGSSRSSTAAAARKAMNIGVLKRALEQNLQVGSLPSLYPIDWNLVWFSVA